MHGNGIARRDDINEITLILPENKKINAFIDELYVDKEGSVISTVTLVYPKMSLTDVSKYSKDILSILNYENFQAR